MVTKPNAINFCKNPKPDTSERAFRHLPPNRPTPRLLPLLPTPPVHSAGTVGRRKKPQTNEQETLLQSLNMCHKRSTPGPKRTELKARWHELQHLGGQQGEGAQAKEKYKGPLRRPWKVSDAWLSTMLTISHSEKHSDASGTDPRPPTSPSQW